MLPKKRVISINISIGKYNEFLNEIIKLAKEKKSNYICVANVHMTVEAYNDKKFQDIVNSAIITTPDGMPIAKAIKIFYNIEQDRVAGMDLFPDLLKEAEKHNLKIFLYGSTDEILNKIKEKAKNLYPNLEIIGFYSPPFRELTEEEKKAIINYINSLEPNIVFVSLGCPKQEKWMAEMYGKINALMIGVGGAFLTFAGTQKRAPKWMQDLSLEWLYRLFQEPKRLFKRYAYTNTKFLYLFTKELLKQKLKTNK
jgi:N-acetylglucosaminyldiphosphoundecaprenol N-acetyl-beta-D-mannosaminyltransferase